MMRAFGSKRQPPQAFDVLVADAFTSDAVPTHLLTDEAFALYMVALELQTRCWR